MASKTFKNLQQVEEYLRQQVNDSLKQDMAKMVKEKIQEHVKSDVYDAYPHPAIYKRRSFIEDSLGSIEQMDSYLIEDGVLEVVDNADFNRSFAQAHGGYGDVDLNKSLAENIEKGYGLMDTPYNKARPFIKKTKEEIKDKGLHIETMKKALRARDIEVI